MTPAMEMLYRSAIAADERYHEHVARVYGEANAGEMRYRPQEFTDIDLIAAEKEFRRVNAQYMGALEAERESDNNVGGNDG